MPHPQTSPTVGDLSTGVGTITPSTGITYKDTSGGYTIPAIQVTNTAGTT